MAAHLSYSTKEVRPSTAWMETSHFSASTCVSNADKEVIAEQGKQAVGDDSGLEVQYVYVRPSSVNEKLSYPGNGDSEKGLSLDAIRRRFMWTRKRLSIAAVLIVLIVVGAILAGVLASRSLAAASSSIPAPNPPLESQQRSIAAVSFEGADNSRVYFLNAAGEIVESSRGGQNTGWTVKKTGFTARKGSKIAAAASRPGQSQEVTVVYMDNSNTLHDIVSDVTGWREGNLATQNIRPAPSTALTIMYNWCKLCANTTLLAFQNSDGSVHLGNQTAGGWHVTQLDSAIDALPGGGLALHPFYRSGEPDQINLWTQKAVTGELVMSDWRERNTVNGHDGWNIKTFTFNVMGLGASIAAAASYTRTVYSGFEMWIQVLTTGSSGVSVDTWSGVKNNFLTHQSAPQALQFSSERGQTYGSLAMTSQGSAYAVLSQTGQSDTITSWAVADDLTTWTPTGSVDLGDGWN